LEQAIHQRSPAQDKRIHRSDRGSQYLSSKYTKRLPEAKTVPSVGSVGDSYDNALAETINGHFKTELIRWLQSQVIIKPFTRLEPASWGA
jgi:putative transposase